MSTRNFINLLIGLVTITVVYFTLRKIGLIDPLFKPKSQRDREKAEDEVAEDLAERWQEEAEVGDNLNEYKGFDTNYYKGSNSSKLISPPSKVNEIAEELYSALNGWFGDDEDAIYAVFKNEMSNAEQVSQVSDAYYNLHDQDLLQKMLSDLDTLELLQVWNIIKSY